MSEVVQRESSVGAGSAAWIFLAIALIILPTCCLCGIVLFCRRHTPRLFARIFRWYNPEQAQQQETEGAQPTENIFDVVRRDDGRLTMVMPGGRSMVMPRRLSSSSMVTPSYESQPSPRSADRTRRKSERSAQIAANRAAGGGPGGGSDGALAPPRELPRRLEPISPSERPPALLPYGTPPGAQYGAPPGAQYGTPPGAQREGPQAPRASSRSLCRSPSSRAHVHPDPTMATPSRGPPPAPPAPLHRVGSSGS